jgi:cysteine desulfurase
MRDMPIYLDNHATTPCDPRVVEAMMPWFTRDFGNASSRQHAYGWNASEAVKKAREEIASLISAEPDEIIFTSGATESINLAIKGAAHMYIDKGRHIITCATEHSAVLDTCKRLEASGFRLTILGVNGEGLLDPDEFLAAIAPDTILAAVMMANNETGLVQDIATIGRICHERKVLFFSDATQAAGKIKIDVNAQGMDMTCLSAHKFYGPKGAGALYVRRRDPRVRLKPLFDGGGHEKGMRSGTLNVPGIVGLGCAASLASQEMDADMNRMGILRDRMEESISREPEVFVNAGHSPRLPTVSSLSFRFTEGQALSGIVNRALAVSSGSACSSASMDPSHVLMAMGLGRDLAFATLRISLGRFTTGTQVDQAVDHILDAVRSLRSDGQIWPLAHKEMLDTLDDWAHPNLRGISGGTL